MIEEYETGENNYCKCLNKYVVFFKYPHSIRMGVDYVLIEFDMEVQPLVTHNAA